MREKKDAKEKVEWRVERKNKHTGNKKRELSLFNLNSIGLLIHCFNRISSFHLLLFSLFVCSIRASLDSLLPLHLYYNRLHIGWYERHDSDERISINSIWMELIRQFFEHSFSLFFSFYLLFDENGSWKNGELLILTTEDPMGWAHREEEIDDGNEKKERSLTHRLGRVRPPLKPNVDVKSPIRAIENPLN